MDKKIIPIPESMKQSKCEELIRNIKQLVTENKYLTELYTADVKPVIKRNRRNDKVLQEMYFFLVRSISHETAEHNAKEFARAFNKWAEGISKYGF